MSFDLSHYNTLGLSAVANAGHIITDEKSLRKILLRSDYSSQATWILGGGSNVILGPKIDGQVLLIKTRGVSFVPGNKGNDLVLLTISAGENWHQLVRYTVAQGLYGLENLALIPGSVGAAPVQNIGAYGVEISDLLHSVRAMHIQSGEIERFDNERCGFAYRDSVFKRVGSPWIILDVTLGLSTTPHFEVSYPDVAEELKKRGTTQVSGAKLLQSVISVRRRKMPDVRDIGNAGSFFKNPLLDNSKMQDTLTQIPDMPVYPHGQKFKVSAARLIDVCGMKGTKVGGFEVWQRQPLVLVNRGEGTFEQLMELSEKIQNAVMDRFGIALEREPGLLGSR